MAVAGPAAILPHFAALCRGLILASQPAPGRLGRILLGLSEETGRRYQQFLMTTQGVGMIGMIVAWQLFDVVFGPVFWTVINVIYPGVTYGS